MSKPITAADLPSWRAQPDSPYTKAIQDFVYRHQPAEEDSLVGKAWREDLAAALESCFPADLKTHVANNLQGIYDPKRPHGGELAKRVLALPAGRDDGNVWLPMGGAQ